MAIQALLVILAVLLVLLFLGVPISYAIAVSSLTAILSSIDLNVAVLTAAQRTFVGMSKFSLTAIPFFILAGNIMNQGGIAKRLVDFVMAILGKMPGALLVTNIGTNALFGAISGSASAAAAAVGSMIRDGAEEQGYDPAVTAATNAASSCSGLLIPPSNALITYSLASGGTSVAALFMAGYIPGILMGLCCMVVAFIGAKKAGMKAGPRRGRRQRPKHPLPVRAEVPEGQRRGAEIPRACPAGCQRGDEHARRRLLRRALPDARLLLYAGRRVPGLQRREGRLQRRARQPEV